MSRRESSEPRERRVVFGDGGRPAGSAPSSPPRHGEATESAHDPSRDPYWQQQLAAMRRRLSLESMSMPNLHLASSMQPIVEGPEGKNPFNATTSAAPSTSSSSNAVILKQRAPRAPKTSPRRSDGSHSERSRQHRESFGSAVRRARSTPNLAAADGSTGKGTAKNHGSNGSNGADCDSDRATNLVPMRVPRASRNRAGVRRSLPEAGLPLASTAQRHRASQPQVSFMDVPRSSIDSSRQGAWDTTGQILRKTASLTDVTRAGSQLSTVPSLNRGHTRFVRSPGAATVVSVLQPAGSNRSSASSLAPVIVTGTPRGSTSFPSLRRSSEGTSAPPVAQTQSHSRRATLTASGSTSAKSPSPVVSRPTATKHVAQAWVVAEAGTGTQQRSGVGSGRRRAHTTSTEPSMSTVDSTMMWLSRAEHAPGHSTQQQQQQRNGRGRAHTTSATLGELDAAVLAGFSSGACPETWSMRANERTGSASAPQRPRRLPAVPAHVQGVSEAEQSALVDPAASVLRRLEVARRSEREVVRSAAAKGVLPLMTGFPSGVEGVVADAIDTAPLASPSAEGIAGTLPC